MASSVYNDWHECVNKSVKVRNSSTPEAQLEPIVNYGVSRVAGQCAPDPRPPVSHQQSVGKPKQRESEWEAHSMGCSHTVYHLSNSAVPDWEWCWHMQRDSLLLLAPRWHILCMSHVLPDSYFMEFSAYSELTRSEIHSIFKNLP